MKLISKDGEKAQCHEKVALVFAIIKNRDTDFSLKISHPIKSLITSEVFIPSSIHNEDYSWYVKMRCSLD